MRRALLCAVMLFAVSQDLLASAKTDSIVTFLGGAQAKFVWRRWAWCNDNYTPKTQAAATAEGKSLMLMDTRTGTERTLVTGLQGPHHMRISRSGKWVTFIDNTTTYIIDLTAASPTKNVLMAKSDCTYWAVVAMWIDPANGAEYVYCLDNAGYPSVSAGNGIYKVKLNSNGTVDRSTATKLTINGLASGPNSIDESISVSADGNKLGSAFPWPNSAILDIPTGRIDFRHNATSAFGCQTNLAPDNSYRIFHCEDDHLGIWMFEANMGTADWLMKLNVNLAGLPSSSTTMDFDSPRWSNHVQYYTATYPMGDNANSYCGMECAMTADDGGSLWSKTADWVKNQINMLEVSKFYLGKFSSDFKTQEKSILIASDQRYLQYGGDGWICNGTTYGNQCTSTSTSPAIRGERPPGLSVVRSGAFVNVHADAAATVRITDARGRIVRMWCGTGDRRLDTRALATGAYLISVTTGERSAAIRLPVTGISR